MVNFFENFKQKLVGVFMKFLKTIVLVALATPLLLLAEGEENHAGVGTVPISEEAAAEIEAQKRESAPTEAEEEGPRETLGYLHNAPPIIYGPSDHKLAALIHQDTRDGYSYLLRLEDGSGWEIDESDYPEALSWRTDDHLNITQNTGLFSWLSKHNYRILHKKNGTSVAATLKEGPFVVQDAHGGNSHIIDRIDFHRREVTLQCQRTGETYWSISPLDETIFKDWQPSHYVIIGVNSRTSFWDRASDALLINVTLDDCVRAKRAY